MNPVRNLNMHKFEITPLVMAAHILLNLNQKLEGFLTG